MLLITRYGTANAVTTAGSTPDTVTTLSKKLGTVYSEQQINILVSEYANKYGVSPIKMMVTIKGESQFSNVQSNCINKDGSRENSWGIVQIHLPDHPEITKEQALDPYFAVEWMAKQFSQGKASQWSYYRKVYTQS